MPSLGLHLKGLLHKLMRVIDGETSDDISPLRSRKSVGKESTFEYDQLDVQSVLEHLSSLVIRVMKKAREMGVAGRLGEVKIRVPRI